MHRVFQSKVELSTYLLLAFALTATVWGMWTKTALVFAPCLILVALLVERIIHSQYVVSHDKLVIQHGKLSRDKTINLASINRIDQVNRFRTSSKVFGQYLVLVLSNGEQIALRPKNESDFVEFITKCRRRIDSSQETGLADDLEEDDDDNGF